MSIKQQIKKICLKIGISEEYLRHLSSKIRHEDIVYNVTKNNAPKHALLIYITSPFLGEETDEKHQNIWQARELARILGEYGYQVDVADFRDLYIRLKKHYDLVVDLIPRDIDIYSHRLNEGALRVAYLTTMNLEVTTENERKRLRELTQRRGCKLMSRRGDAFGISPKIEEFDAAWYIGNEYNYTSYCSLRMPPVSFIRNNGYEYRWYDADTQHNPAKFLFLGSSGQVHKGLDLLLEIFARPECEAELYVCSCYENETDFCEEYREELYNTPNIHPEGFIEVFGERFREIANECAYMILPSCAEGMAGSVLTAMSAGLIPIVSKDCGFDEDDVLCMPDCKLETIADYVSEYAKKDKEWVKENSERAYKIAMTKYNREAFTKSVYDAMDQLLKMNM